jgi:uncharacterized protein (DUF1800 family)
MADQSLLSVADAPADGAVPVPLLALGALAATALAGCGGGGGGSDAPAPAPVVPANTITALTIQDVGGGAVTVDSIVGTSAGVAFTLDGKAVSTSKAADPGVSGAATAIPFAVSGTGGSASLTVTINPTPTAVATASYTTVRTTRSVVTAAAFPPSWDELMGYSGMTHNQIINRLVGRMSPTPAEAYPAWIDSPILTSTEYNALTSTQKDAYNNRRYPQRQEFKAWWFRQMVTNPDSLTERMLLFWHNLWTSSASSLDDPELIARQHRLYRQHVGGNLRTFLKEMCKDPGMCLYLDSALNKKGAPNENFARELLELFTLGERTTYQAYEEDDIPIVARCFTGYGLKENRTYKFNPSDHDYTPKTLWGQPIAGTFTDGDDVIDLILGKNDGAGHSCCGKYLVTRLWREFIGELQTGDDAAILVLADRFRDEFAWDLPSLYKALLTSAAAKDATRRGTRVRSPIELYVGYYRALSVTPDAWDGILYNAYILDQDLLDPPNVFGWAGGTSWITVKTLVDRRTFMDWIGWGERAKVPARLLDVLDLLLMSVDPLTPPSESINAGLRARQYILDPAFNLR